MPARKTRKPARKPAAKKQKDITEDFAKETLNLIGRINTNVHDQNFAAVANSLLFVKNVCVEMLEGKKSIK